MENGSTFASNITMSMKNKLETKVKHLKDKVRKGDVLYMRLDILEVKEDGYVLFGENGRAANGWLFSDEGGNSFDNQIILAPKNVILRGEIINVDGKNYRLMKDAD